MALPGISADHIAGAAGGFEPQRKNNFQIMIPSGGGVISLALHSCPFPAPGVGELTIQFGNEERFVAGVTAFESVELVIKDYVKGPANSVLREWRRQVYDPETGRIGLARDYKRQCSLQMFGPDGSNIRTWILDGVWPSALSPGGGAMGDAANNMVSVTLEIDKAYPE